jgi:hypothetical protein
MADALPSRLGQANGAGSTDALFLKLFSGEVMTAFEIATVFMDRNMVRTIKNGRSAAFPIVGRATARYHTPGTEINGTAVLQNERVITIDDMLISDNFVAEIDELRNHYDVRRVFSKESGLALGYAFDRNCAQVGVLAARTASNLTGEPGGSVIAQASMNTTSSVLRAAVFSAAQALDERNVSDTDRCVFVRPAQYYLLAQDTTVLNKDWGGAGSYSDGDVMRIAGVEIVKTNQLPSTLVNTGPTAYQGDFTKTFGLVMHKAAIGTLKLLDVNTKISEDPRRLGWLIVSKMAVGHGVLRPACAVELAIP